MDLQTWGGHRTGLETGLFSVREATIFFPLSCLVDFTSAAPLNWLVMTFMAFALDPVATLDGSRAVVDACALFDVRTRQDLPPAWAIGNVDFRRDPTASKSQRACQTEPICCKTLNRP